MRTLTVCVTTYWIVCNMAVSAWSADWLVKADGSGDFATIQSAIDSATSGDNIFLEMATFTGMGNIGVDFKGKAVVVAGLGGPDDTVIDCAHLDRGFKFVMGEPQGASLRNVTILNGNAITDGERGGGILVDGASPVIHDVKINGCTAADGGGIHIAGSSAFPRIENTVIEACVATGDMPYMGGGGVSVSRAFPLIVHSDIHHNEAQNGGGLLLTGESLLLVGGSYTDLLVHGNTADDDGGGIKISQGHSSLVISRNLIWGNTARNGGGMHLLSVRQGASINRNTVTENSAAVSGAGLYFGGFTGAKVEQSIVAYNTGTAANSIRCSTMTGAVDCSLIWNPHISDLNTCTLTNNVAAHPQFCGVLGSANFSIQTDSAANAANNACGVLMGARDVGCGRTAIVSDSWGNLKTLYR